jgi:hypothetical protein
MAPIVLIAWLFFSLVEYRSVSGGWLFRDSSRRSVTATFLHGRNGREGNFHRRGGVKGLLWKKWKILVGGGGGFQT